MSTDDGKALVQDIAAKIRALTEQRDILLCFAKEMAIGAYREHEAMDRAKAIIRELKP